MLSRKLRLLALVAAFIVCFAGGAMAAGKYGAAPANVPAHSAGLKQRYVAGKWQKSEWCRNHPKKCHKAWCKKHPKKCHQAWCNKHPKKCH